MKSELVQPGSPTYPPALLRGGPNWTPPVIHVLGNAALLRQPLTALFCSSGCPGQLILQSFDLVAHFRDEERAVISGFHTPIEKECLTILLRGKSPIIICPARGLDRYQVPTAWKSGLDKGRLLVLSAFPPGVQRATTALAIRRNEFVAALASEIIVLHATPGGRLESLVREFERAGRLVTRLPPA